MKNKQIPDNTIIGWINGKAIVLNDNGDICYVEIPEEFANLGEVIDTSLLLPISNLSNQEQIRIMDHLNNRGFDIEKVQ